MTVHVTKLYIKFKYIITVNGYGEIIESEFNIHIWKDILHLVLLKTNSDEYQNECI